MKKLYLMLIACCSMLAANAQQIFQPNAEISFTGGATTYCRGDAINPLTFTYSICNSGTGIPTGASCTAYWYYNPTNTTTISGSTTTISGPYTFNTPTTGSSSLSFTPVLPIGGDYYFFCVISWTGGTAGCPGGVSGSLTSTIQHVRVTPPPIITATGGTELCVGSTLKIYNGFTGGVWTTDNSGVVSVTPTAFTDTAILTGISGGSVNISYKMGVCYSRIFVTANDTPTAIMPTSGLTCQASTVALSSSPSGGNWTSDNPPVASVGTTTGIMTTGATGTARITYTNATTGCFTRKTFTVQPIPAPITGTTAICQTSTTTLNNASAPAGTWISSNPTGMSVNTSGVVTGTALGTAIISYRLGNGCQTTTVVTVNAPPPGITGPSQVCAGSNITLLNGASGGSWLSGDITKATVGPTSGIVSGVAAGNVNISYTIPGCASVWKALTINPLPGTIGGMLNTCYGSTTLLTSTAPGGTWVSDNPTVATVDTFTGVVTGITMGMSIISYRVGSGCFTTATVTVNPLAPIVGSDSVCVGSVITLTNIVGGGTWVSGNPDIAKADTFTGNIHGLVNGITYVEYRLPTGCNSIFFLTVIPPLPPIAGPIELCSATDVILSNGVTGGRWITSNPYVAEIDSVSGNLIGHFPDTATITYTRFGCITRVNVTVDPLPTPTVSFDWVTGKLSTLPVYASYQWYDSVSGPIPGATSSFITVPNLARTHYVRVTDFNGCAANSDYFRTPLGVNNVNLAAQCNVYPNPASAVIYIDAPVKVRAVISSVEGKVVAEAENAKEINVATMPPGLYLIGLYDDSGQLITMKKITKQ